MTFNINKKFIYSFFFFLQIFTLYAQNTAFPSLEPLYTFSNTETELSGDKMLEMSLVISRCEPTKIPLIIKHFQNIKKQLSQNIHSQMTEEDKGELCLSILYSTLLKQYEQDQTKTDIIFEKGSYNCVSSSIMYMCLAKSLGLTVKLQSTKTHAFVTLYTTEPDGSRKKIDVETTNPSGFNPGTKKQTQDNHYFIVPKKYYSNRREVSDVTTLSFIEKNICSIAIDNKDYNKAVPSAVSRMALLQDDDTEVKDARKDFDITVINYASILQKKSNETALEWTKEARNRWNGSEQLNSTIKNLAINSINDRLNKNDFSKARAILDDNAKDFSETQISSIDSKIFGGELRESIKSENFENQLLIAQEAAKNKSAQSQDGKKQLDSCLEYIWTGEINRLTQNKNYLEAAFLSNKAVENLPDSKIIRNIQNQSWRNFDVIVHNDFAQAVNQNELQKANQILLEGLMYHSDSTILQKDQATLKALQ